MRPHVLPDTLVQARCLFPQAVQSAVPVLSIAIPALNEEKALPNTLRSVCRSACHQLLLEGGVPFEVMVVDNGSTDATAALAHTFGALVVSAPERGISHARNAGLHAAKGDILLWADADATVPQQWALRHMRHYQDPSVVAVSGSTILPGQHWSLQFLRTLYDCFRERDPHIRYHRQYGWEGGGCNVSYRRQLGLDVGGYSTVVQRGEDAWIWIALKQHAKRTGGRVVDAFRDRHMRVEASARRFATIDRIIEELRMHLKQSYAGSEKFRAQDYR
jgi:glycosyltransferase involved in cell wall biosynthesis